MWLVLRQCCSPAIHYLIFSPVWGQCLLFMIFSPQFPTPLNTAHLLRRLLLQNPLLFCLQAGQFCWIFPILETFPYIPPLQLFLPPHALPQEHLALHVPPPEGAGGSPAFGCRLMEWAQNKSRPEALTHPTDQKGCCWTGTIFASWSQPIFPVEPQHWHNVSPCPFPSP